MNARLLAAALWLTGGFLTTTLLLRFGLRLVGVRDDIPFPALVYSFTRSLVQPFYSFFPTSERFDESAVEVASLLAAGTVLFLTIALYAVRLLLERSPSTRRRSPK